MDSADIKRRGMAVENMIQTDGWKYVEKYLAERETQYINELKKAENFRDVLRLQAQLEIIGRLRNTIVGWIREKNMTITDEGKDR